MLTGMKLRRNGDFSLIGNVLIALPIFVFAWIVLVFFLSDASPAWLTQSWTPVLPVVLAFVAIVCLLIFALTKRTLAVLSAISVLLVSVAAFVMFGTLYLG